MGNKLKVAAKRDGATRRTRLATTLKGLRKNEFSTLRMNLEGVKARHEKLQDREHLVVPAVILTEGVHNGSAGPLYYPGEELRKNPEAWNHMPVVDYHPEDNSGRGISARDPEVLNIRGLGVCLNSRWDNRLKTEVWLDIERVKKVDKRILDNVESGVMTELSTGLFTDNEYVDNGEWKGERYVAVARNYRPDHLAILPDKKGSCSIADGAGLLRNSEHTKEPVRKLLVEVEEDPSVVGEVSNEDETNQKETLVMNKAETIKSLIENSGGIWAEGDRTYLETKNDEQLKTLHDATVKNEAEAGEDEKKEEEKPVDFTEHQVTTQAAKTEEEEEKPTKNMSFEEVLNSASPDIREMITSGLRVQAATKAKLVKVITSNARNRFTPEQLNVKPLEELENLVALVGGEKKAPVANYAGLGEVGSPTANTETPLEIPTFTFAPAAKK